MKLDLQDKVVVITGPAKGMGQAISLAFAEQGAKLVLTGRDTQAIEEVATKTRAMVSGSGKKPWRQKGTGRARVGEIRNPLWRGGGTVFGPQPRSYEYQLPKKVEKGALRAALMEKLQSGAVIIGDALTVSAVKTKAAAAVLKAIGVTGKALLIDARLDENFAMAVRNLARVTLVQSNLVTARDVANTRQVVVTTAAMAKLEAALSEPTRAARA